MRFPTMLLYAFFLMLATADAGVRRMRRPARVPASGWVCRSSGSASASGWSATRP